MLQFRFTSFNENTLGKEETKYLLGILKLQREILNASGSVKLGWMGHENLSVVWIYGWHKRFLYNPAWRKPLNETPSVTTDKFNLF